ncbi:MAG: hypothetical protein LBB65_07995, partial [Burkholderiales bacterium]|nr:hypothetical protein [Burkholderiales bacterium]
DAMDGGFAFRFVAPFEGAIKFSCGRASNPPAQNQSVGAAFCRPHVKTRLALSLEKNPSPLVGEE